MMQKKLYMRKLDQNDLHAIVDIEERVTGIARPNYWAKRIDLSEATQPHWASIVAEIENRVVGFLVGGSSELKFGLRGPVAWIDIIGVDPVYRVQGVGRALIEEFTAWADYHGVKTIFTLIDNGNTKMEQFFSRVGFIQGKILHFQKEIGYRGSGSRR
ncbi:MAG: GNAT family N-acetyltransferase [Candidatus Binatia bacterium]